MAAKVRRRGLLYDQAAQHRAALEAGDEAAGLQMLSAWSDSYWGVRQELDTFLAKVEAARAAGTPPGISWAYQERRLRNVLDETRRGMARYAQHAAAITSDRQRESIRAGLTDAGELTDAIVQEGLPGLGGSLDTVNPEVLERGVGFLADGSVLANHLAATMPADAADAVRSALLHGLATGKSQDWMTRAATKALGLSHGRAVTIMRTESLRAYRSASQATYLANADVLGSWTWNAHLDARCCVACVLMDGTEHPLTATLDGHPRCRCAMVPRTKTWEELGAGPGLPDTRPPVRSGKEWLEGQSETTQRAIIGKAKFDAWKDGKIGLDDMVARPHSDAWGTMRTERSLKAILEGRDANWMDVAPEAPDLPAKAAQAAPVASPQGRVNPFSGDALADALSPTRKRTKAAILKDLEQTKAGKDLAAQIKAFTETRGGVANLRKNLAATIDGTASDAVKAKAQTFLDAMDAYPTDQVPELFRGMAIKVEQNTAAWWDEFEAQFKPGSTFDLNASSFTSSEKKAAEFSGMIGGTKRASSNYTAVRFYLEEGSHALPVERLSKFGGEKEWITGGKFQVVDMTPGTAAQPYMKVVIRQVEGLG